MSAAAAEVPIVAGVHHVVDAHLWGLGIILELLGTIFNVAGKQCIRYAQTSGKIAFWFAGVMLWSVVYPVFDISALNFAPESTVFSVDGMIVVWNIALAPYTLREPVTRSKLTAALVVTIGTIGAGSFGSHSDSAASSDDYMALLRSPGALVYYLLFILVVGGCYVLMRRHDPRSKVGGLLMGVLAGWFGGCGFFLKVLIQFVRDDAWGSAWLYIFAVLTFSYMACAVYAVSLALRRHEAVYIIPIYEGVLIVNGAVNGYLVLRDGNASSTIFNGLYWCSVLTILLGLYLIVWWPTRLLGDGEERVRYLDFLMRPDESEEANPSSADLPKGRVPDEQTSLVGSSAERHFAWTERFSRRARLSCGACYCTCVCPCAEELDGEQAQRPLRRTPEGDV